MGAVATAIEAADDGIAACSRELQARRDLLLDELLGHGGRFPVLHRPADDIAAVDVQDHVQVVVAPLRRSQQLGDVPAPQLIGRLHSSTCAPPGRRKSLRNRKSNL